MAVTTLTPVAAKGGSYPGYPTAGTAITFAAVDATDGGRFVPSGNDLLLIKNEDTDPQTYGLTSQADGFGRTGTISGDALAAGAIEMMYLKSPGWVNSSGYIIIPPPSDPLVKFAVIQI